MTYHKRHFGGEQRVFIPNRQLPFERRRRVRLILNGHHTELAGKGGRWGECRTAEYFIFLDYFCGRFRVPGSRSNVCVRAARGVETGVGKMKKKLFYASFFRFLPPSQNPPLTHAHIGPGQ